MKKRLTHSQANDLELRAALAAFARANNLNIVPDNDVIGTVTLDVRDLPLDRMMRAFTWTPAIALATKSTPDSRAQFRNADLHRGLPAPVAQRGRPKLRDACVGNEWWDQWWPRRLGCRWWRWRTQWRPGRVPSTGGSAVNLTADNPIISGKSSRKKWASCSPTRAGRLMAVNMTAGLVAGHERPSALKCVGDYLSVIDRNVHR